MHDSVPDAFDRVQVTLVDIYASSRKPACARAFVVFCDHVALPMVQAVLLLGIYALLPMVVVLSRYAISMMVIGAMAIFTVKF